MIETILVTVTEKDVQTDIKASPMALMKTIGILLEIAEQNMEIPQAELAEAILLANKNFPQLRNAEDKTDG